jgi:uncharacterized protein with beta-barrel porin domain
VINREDVIGTYRQTGEESLLSGPASLTAQHGAILEAGEIRSSLLADSVVTGDVLVSGNVVGSSFNVLGGHLSLTGSIESNTVIARGAKMSGTGAVKGGLTNHGSLDLAASDQTARKFAPIGSNGTAAQNLEDLVVTGTFTNRGELEMRLSDTENHDLIRATRADLGGTLTLSNIGQGLAAGEVVDLVQAGSYVNGFDVFRPLGFENGLLFDPSTGKVIGLAGGMPVASNDSYLNLNGSQSSIYLALFEDAVGAGVNNVKISGSDGQVRFVSGASDGDAQLVAALNQATFLKPGTVDAATINRLSPGVHRGMADQAEQTLRSHARQAVEAAPVVRKGDTQVFAIVESSSAGVDNTSTEAGYDLTSVNFTAGVRQELNSNLILGGMLGVDSGSVSGSLIDTDSTGMVVGGFANCLLDANSQTKALLSLAYGNYSFDASRQSFGGTALTNGVGASAIEFATGLTTTLYQDQALTITPGVGFRYMRGTVDAFQEKGAGVSLDVDSQDIDACLLEVGVGLRYKIDEQTTFVGRLGYVKDLTGSDQALGAHFAAAGSGATGFSVSAPGVVDDAAVIGLGLEYELFDSATLGIHYRGDLRTDSQLGHSFGVGLTASF